MLIDFSFKRIIHDLSLLRLLDLVDVLDCLEISEMIDSGFPSLADNFGRVLVEECLKHLEWREFYHPQKLSLNIGHLKDLCE